MSTYIKHYNSCQELSCRELCDAGKSSSEIDMMKNENIHMVGDWRGLGELESMALDSLKL